ncbi:MAG: hypothetical protein NTU53_18475 [Planctomycetota bacterium]|nr:hypothetical protein [Planctomycetota bacterium]
MRFMKGMFAVAMFGLLAVGSARAESIISAYSGVTTGPVAGVYTHEYQVTFIGQNSIEAFGAHPDLFAVLDVHGLVGASFKSFVGPDSDWTVAFPWQTTTWSYNAPTIFGGDLLVLENVQVTKTAGADVVNVTGAQITLGTLYIDSTIKDLVPGVCVGGYEQTANNTELTNSDPTMVPIPVPAAMWTGLGLLGLLAFRKATR